MSGYVALCRPLPGVVVTYFVTGSRITSLQMDDRRSWRTRVRHDHRAMTGESGAVTRICERALPLPVKVPLQRRPPRPGPVSPPAGEQVQRVVGWGAGLGGVDGHRHACVGGTVIVLKLRTR